jgi:hypothetical protein
MAYVLSWRRKNQLVFDEMQMFQTNGRLRWLRENPGIRWRKMLIEPTTAINYLEIGVFRGDNIIDMSKSYCKHPDSKMYCVDPWIDYEEYNEYKGKIESIHDIFIENINKQNLWDRIKVYRDFSHNVVPTLQDDFFDIAFIDGNHETDFVYKDAVMVLPKMKSGGTIIFDDYNWKDAKVGIDRFLSEYSSQLKNVRYNTYQLFVEKL